MILNIERTEIADLIPSSITIGDNLRTIICAYIAFRVASLHTSIPTHDQRSQGTRSAIEYQPVIRPLYENIANADNYYQEQAELYKSRIIDELKNQHGIDKSGALNFNTQDKKIFYALG